MDKHELGYCVSQTCGDHTDHLVGEGRCEKATGWIHKIIDENLKKENMKHTPAPWEYADGNNAGCEINIGETTCTVDRQNSSQGSTLMKLEEQN